MYLIIHQDDLLLPAGERRNVATGDEPMSDDQWYEFCYYAGCYFPVVMVASTAPTVAIREDVRAF